MSPSSRRAFLKTSAAALALPTIVPASVFAKDDTPAPSDRVVIGLIGAGDLGRRHHLARHLIPNKRVQVAAVCDVDRHHRDQAALDVQKHTGKRIEAYNDFRDLCDRQDIDAVLTALPDHWHALIAIYAMQSGKDVYGEKPLTLTIAEGRRMVDVARRYGTVFQTGSQQRSDRRFRQACELVRNQVIGKLERVDTHIGEMDAGQWQAPTTPPPQLDWDFWLGPAKYVDYTPNRCHQSFRWFRDYSGGKMTDWGAHHNDIAQWALDADHSGPVKVKGTGRFSKDGPYDLPEDFDVTYTYANGVELHCHAKGENGVKFTGSEGWVFVNRSKITASNRDWLKKKFTDQDVRLYNSGDHFGNWLDCIKSRELPICDVEVGHRSVTVCHMGNIAIELGRELQWDPVAEQFVDDEQANRFLSRPMRAPWHI